MFLDGAVRAAPGRAPRLGEHTDEILRAGGYGEAEIQALRQAGVMASIPPP